MQNVSFKQALAGIAASALLAGCVAPAPVLDSKFGEAFNTAKAQQTLNPDASMNKMPVVGLDGQSGDAVIDKYHKSFETPPAAANTFTIGIGSESSGGK